MTAAAQPYLCEKGEKKRGVSLLFSLYDFTQIFPLPLPAGPVYTAQEKEHNRFLCPMKGELKSTVKPEAVGCIVSKTETRNSAAARDLYEQI